MLSRFYGLIFLLVLGYPVSGAAEKTAQIIKQGFVKVHKGPSTSATVIAFAKFGEYYPVLWESTAWIKIEYIEVEGWIKKEHVKLITGLGKPIPSKPGPKVTKPAKPPVRTSTRPKPAKRKIYQPPKLESRKMPSIYDSPSEIKKSEKQPLQRETKKPLPIRETERRPQKPIIKSETTSRKIVSQKDVVIQIAADTTKKMKADTTPRKELEKPKPLPAVVETLYVKVLIPRLNVFTAADTTTPILGVATKDEYFLLLRGNAEWLNIPFGDTTGWVERHYVKLVDKKEKPFLTGLIHAMLAIGAVIIVIIIIGAILLVLRNKLVRRVSVKKSVLIIARQKKQITYSLTNTPATLEECFAEIAFATNRTDNLKVAENRIFYHAPDVLMVDWKFSPTIEQEIGVMLSSKTSISNIPVIFFNVPDSVRMERTRQHSNVYYLDISFTDQELFKLITPQIVAGHKARIIRKSVQSSAMEGEISEGSLNAVLQFVEIGKKTGCLLVDDETPFGLIYFEKGIITYAATQNNKAREAVEEILALKIGYFRFAAGRRSMEKNCSLPVMPVLMEFAHKNDEGRRD